MHYFPALFGKELYMLWTDLLSIIRSLNTVFIVILVMLLADGNITSMTNTCCCEYSVKTPDDGQ